MKIKVRLAICLLLLVSACSLIPENRLTADSPSPSPNPGSAKSSPTVPASQQLSTPSAQVMVTQTATEMPLESNVSPTVLSNNALPIPTTLRFSDEQYWDERGSEYQFVLSYFNAIRRTLLPMAYYFWNNDPALAGPYESFAQTHADLKPEEITFVKAGTSGAAGSVYSTLGLIVKGLKGIVPYTWVGCYTIRTPNPALFDSKEYTPRHFTAGRLIEIPAGETANTALETACASVDFGMLEVTISNSDSTESVDAKYYIDSRSDPVALISSFWNALNRQEYARAYSYFEAPAIFPGPYSTFKAGYLDTMNVSGSIPPPEKLAATGNWYWRVPVSMKAETKSGVQQAFVGCYVIHQSDPALYVSPPFKPMGIQKAHFEALSISTDAATSQAALSSACDGLP